MEQENLVSVPYRGATFLNATKKTTKFSFIVSVPYRGATFLNDKGRRL